MSVTIGERKDHAWFALLDAESCRLLCCSMTRLGKHHVDEFDTLKNTLPEQEHTRPMTETGATHNMEEKERRFAGEIVAWLRKKSGQQKIDHLVILAAPRMLGVLRMIPLGSLKGHVAEFKGELMHLNAGQLAEHSTVRDMLVGGGN